MAERIPPSSTSTFRGLVIENVLFTDAKLGSGSDATVFEVDWNGTRCAAKRLHEILLEDQSAGGVAKLIGNFEAECLTWSKLRHPGVVQFLGVHIDRGSHIIPKSCLPVLVMEKMDTSLRSYLEDHSKEQFPLHQKSFVLRQVTQALAYLHSQNPPLVHHDMSPNNVLLNVVSFVTKVSDFGMSRAINPSALSRKSSIKGTQAFMAPEALHDPPRYNEKLDVFSFGNIIISTLTHEWPNPGPPTRYHRDQLVGLSELQRREHHVVKFTAQEKQLFLPIVRQCLENRPDKRPSSVMLVQELKRIKSTILRVAAPIEHLRQQLSAKEEEFRQMDKAMKEKNEALKEKDAAMKEKNEALRKKDEAMKEKNEALKGKDEAMMEKDEALRKKDEAMKEKNEALKGKDEALKEKDEALKKKDEALKEKDEALKEKDIDMRTMQADIQQLRSQNSVLQQQLAAKEAEGRQQGEEVVGEKSATIQAQQAETQQLSDQPAVSQKVRHPLRDWRKPGKCQKVIQHSPGGGSYYGVAVNSEGLLAVTDHGNKCIHLVAKEGSLMRSIGKGVLSGTLGGIIFDLKGNVWVADWGNNKVLKLSQDGRLLQTIDHVGSKANYFNRPTAVSVNPEGLVYICDSANHRVTVYDEEGMFLFAFGSKGSGPGCFDRPWDVTFGSDGLVYVTDSGNRRVCIWSKEGSFQRDFKTKYSPTCIAATGDNHLLITSWVSHTSTVMVYMLGGQLVYEFGRKGSDPGRFSVPSGICVDDSGAVYVADYGNKRVQVF